MKPFADALCGFSSLERIFVLFALLSCAATVVPAQTFATIHTFEGKATPYSGVVQGTDGRLYGTTYYGGKLGSGFCEAGCGMVYRITPTGATTQLFLFDGGANGRNPGSNLVEAHGVFYGTTSAGGTSQTECGGGTIFSITTSGTLTTLYSFGVAEVSCAPNGDLLFATDGNLYGTTYRGANNGDRGIIYRITPGGTFMPLYSFSAGQIAGNAPSSLMQAANGNLYGIASTTLGNGSGTFFEMTLSGAVALQHSLPQGQYYGPISQASNGNFYGTAVSAISNGAGTVFSIAPDGTFTTLAELDGDISATPMIQATDGNLYGTTSSGGDFGDGSVFELTPGGTLTTLFSFCQPPGCAGGAIPLGQLVQDTDGLLYGTTRDAPNLNAHHGTIFTLSLGLAPFIKTLPIGGTVGQLIHILGTDLTGATAVSFNGATAAFTVVSSSEITANVPTGATSGTVEVVTPGATLSSNLPFTVQQ